MIHDQLYNMIYREKATNINKHIYVYDICICNDSLSFFK